MNLVYQAPNPRSKNTNQERKERSCTGIHRTRRRKEDGEQSLQLEREEKLRGGRSDLGDFGIERELHEEEANGAEKTAPSLYIPPRARGGR